MKVRKTKSAILAFLLAIIMLIGVFASCKANTPSIDETDQSSSTEATSGEETTEGASSIETSSNEEKESDTEKEGDTGEGGETMQPDYIELDGEYGEIIQNADALKDGVDVYYDASRKHYTVENQNMALNYDLSASESLSLITPFTISHKQ